MKTILITGINGYLGSLLAKTFMHDYQIIGLEYSLNNLTRIKGYDFKVYSVENGIPDELFQNHQPDIIIHAATFYGRQNEAVKTIARANLFIPFDLFDKAIDNGCKLFVNTDTVLDRFVSAYALTKRHFQEWLYLRRFEIKIVNMQLEHFYGPNAPESNFISAMMKRLSLNEPKIDLTAGEQMRDFVFIDDVLAAYKTVLECDLMNDYNEFCVATQQLTSIKQVMTMLKEITGSTTHLNFGAIPYRENELMHSISDNSALLALGWKPQYTINEGLVKCVNNK